MSILPFHQSHRLMNNLQEEDFHFCFLCDIEFHLLMLEDVQFVTPNAKGFGSIEIFFL